LGCQAFNVGPLTNSSLNAAVLTIIMMAVINVSLILLIPLDPCPNSGKPVSSTPMNGVHMGQKISSSLVDR